jgi:plastocyanin
MLMGVFTILGVVLAGCGPGNQAPTVQVISPQVSAQGQATANSKVVAFEVKGEDKDLPANQKLTYSWDCGDNKPTSKKDTQETKFTCTYDKPGTYTVKVVAIDDKKAKSKEVSIKLDVKNAAPTADIKATPPSGAAPLTVTFDASGSKDPDGTIASYEWDFGDNQKGSGQKVNHDYKDPKAYTVKLTVTDNDGAKAEKTITVTVEAGSSAKIWEVHMMTSADGKFFFEPAVLKISPGDTVRWICKSGCPHSATSYSKENNKAQGLPAGAKSFNTQLLNPDGTYEVKFDGPEGSYPYFCIPHVALGQVGLIIVGKYTDLSAEFLNSLQGSEKSEMQKLIEQAKKL